MERETRLEHRLPLKWKEMDPYRRRSTHVGMWAWVWQRISAITVIFLLVLHLTLTYMPLLQFLLLVAVTFHAALGIRVILLDLNLVNVKYQKLLIYGLLALGLAALVIVWNSLY